MVHSTIHCCGCLLNRRKHHLFLTLQSMFMHSPMLPRFSFFKNSYSLHSHNTKDGSVCVNPLELVKDDLMTLHQNIRKELSSDLVNLSECCHYYFDDQGKLFRPMTILLMGRACNAHLRKSSTATEGQRYMAMIAEMIHTASLLHDDVIDDATKRRNKPSVNQLFTPKQCILAGDFILSRASILLAQLGNTTAVTYYSQIINDLVKGELMQLIQKDNIDERFTHYLAKTFRKTASLVAYSCKSVALLSDGDDRLQQTAFDYGKNLGIAFQLVDDALDFVSTTDALGKPTGADLSLGLATAPVLFAAQKYPDLHDLIARRFRKANDVKRAIEFVQKSDGIKETFILANKYASEAAKSLSHLHDSKEKEALINLSKYVVERSR